MKKIESRYKPLAARRHGAVTLPVESSASRSKLFEQSSTKDFRYDDDSFDEENSNDNSDDDSRNTSYNASDVDSVEVEERPQPSTSHALRSWESLKVVNLELWHRKLAKTRSFGPIWQRVTKTSNTKY